MNLRFVNSNGRRKSVIYFVFQNKNSQNYLESFFVIKVSLYLHGTILNKDAATSFTHRSKQIFGNHIVRQLQLREEEGMLQKLQEKRRSLQEVS